MLAGSTFRPIQRLTITLMLMLGVNALVNFVSCVSSIAAWELLYGNTTLGEEPPVNLLHGIIASGVQVLWFLITGTVFLVWVVRANKNALANGAYLRITPGSAGGYFFVPVLNLWKPYQAMKDLWQASVPGRPYALRLPIWWFLWLVYGLMLLLEIQQTSMTIMQGYWIAPAAFGRFSGPIGMAVSLAAMPIVWSISRSQSDLFARRSTPPPVFHTEIG